MSRYYFDVEDGHAILDESGTELPDLDAARVEAVRRSGTILHDTADKFWPRSKWKMIVADEHGLVLFILHFAAVSSPATEQYRAKLSLV